MIDKEKTAPISPKMMKINGNDLIRELGIEPSPRLGKIIAILLEEVIERPEMNTREKLLDRSMELNKLDYRDLEKMSEKAKETALNAQYRIDDEIKKKHYVQ